jgi:hypothetical protein
MEQVLPLPSVVVRSRAYLLQEEQPFTAAAQFGRVVNPSSSQKYGLPGRKATRQPSHRLTGCDASPPCHCHPTSPTIVAHGLPLCIPQCMPATMWALNPSIRCYHISVLWFGHPFGLATGVRVSINSVRISPVIFLISFKI